jgi:hypothetical protein
MQGLAHTPGDTKVCLGTIGSPEASIFQFSLQGNIDLFHDCFIGKARDAWHVDIKTDVSLDHIGHLAIHPDLPPVLQGKVQQQIVEGLIRWFQPVEIGIETLRYAVQFYLQTRLRHFVSLAHIALAKRAFGVVSSEIQLPLVPRGKIGFIFPYSNTAVGQGPALYQECETLLAVKIPAFKRIKSLIGRQRSISQAGFIRDVPIFADGPYFQHNLPIANRAAIDPIDA